MFYAMVRDIDKVTGLYYYRRKGRMCKTEVAPTRVVRQHPHGGYVQEYGKEIVYARNAA